jgi:general secretion pathway protein F
MVGPGGRAMPKTLAAGSNGHAVAAIRAMRSMSVKRFKITGYRASEGIVHLSVSACSADEARERARADGYDVLEVKRRTFTFFASRFVNRFDTALFAQELLSLMEAGMGLVEALALLVRRARSAQARAVLSSVVRAVDEGRAFSHALEAAGGAIPVLFIASMRSSERTGDLVEGLRRYLNYHRQVSALRAKVVSASVYPVLLLVVGGAVVLFLLMYVIPKFSVVYAGMDRVQLPLMSRWLMQWGQLASEHAGGLLAGLVAVMLLGWRALHAPPVRAAAERALWRLPRVGEYLRIYQLTRFTRTVAMLLKGGVPLVAALDMTAPLLQAQALRSGLEFAARELREGQGLAETFRIHGLANDIGARLLEVGERSGDLPSSMERIAAFYDDELARGVDWFTRLFEPLLMILMGGVIGGIVILMYLPVFQLASSIR